MIQPQPPITDPEVPALELLLGADAVDLLDAVVSEAGGRCESARLAQIRYVPGRLVTAQFVAQVAWDGRPPTTETLIASSGLAVPDTTPRVEVDSDSISVWRYPNDPFLPGLAVATDPERVRRLLEQLGAPEDAVRLRRRAYRPGRRAVIEAVSPNARIFLKIVRPSAVADLQKKHADIAGRVPVPHSYGWSEELGLVAIQAMPGKTLRKALQSGSSRLPTGRQLIALLDDLPDLPPDTPLVAGPIARAPDHGHLLKAVVPELSDRIDDLVGSLQGVEHPPVSVHGDFHSSQVLTRRTQVVGLIDVDTSGRGARADDLASMLAHVSSLALTSSARRRVERYGRALISDFDTVTDPGDLRTRVAAMVVGFATGPFRVQESKWPAETERRIGLAERWLASAHT